MIKGSSDKILMSVRPPALLMVLKSGDLTSSAGRLFMKGSGMDTKITERIGLHGAIMHSCLEIMKDAFNDADLIVADENSKRGFYQLTGELFQSVVGFAGESGAKREGIPPGYPHGNLWMSL